MIHTVIFRGNGSLHYLKANFKDNTFMTQRLYYVSGIQYRETQFLDVGMSTIGSINAYFSYTVGYHDGDLTSST